MNRALSAVRPITVRQWLGVAVAVVVGGGLIGLVAWNTLVASAPLYSYGPQEELGSRAYVPVLLAVALVGDFLVPTYAFLVGLAVGLPGFLLSPWTAPRGDSDGLWVFIIPMLSCFVGILMGVAVVGGWVRRRLMRHREVRRASQNCPS